MRKIIPAITIVILFASLVFAIKPPPKVQRAFEERFLEATNHK